MYAFSICATTTTTICADDFHTIYPFWGHPVQKHTNVCMFCVLQSHRKRFHPKRSFCPTDQEPQKAMACCHGYVYLKPEGLTSRGMAWQSRGDSMRNSEKEEQDNIKTSTEGKR